MTSNKETLDHSYGERVERNRHCMSNSEPATMAQHPTQRPTTTGIRFLMDSLLDDKSLGETGQIHNEALKSSDHGVGGGSHTHSEPATRGTHMHALEFGFNS